MPKIPDGWERIKGDTIKRGDMISTAGGFVDAGILGKSSINKYFSAIGHPTALFECVIRKKAKVKHGRARPRPADSD